MENNLHRVCFREPMSMVSLWRKLNSVCKNIVSRDSWGLFRGQLESLCLETPTSGIFRSQTHKELNISVICKLQKTQILVLSEPSCTTVNVWYQGSYSALVGEALWCSLWLGNAQCSTKGSCKTFQKLIPSPLDGLGWDSATATKSTWSYQHRTALLLQSAYQEAI